MGWQNEHRGRWAQMAWLGVLMLCTAIAGCRREAAYPERPITIVCPWAAGGGTDRVARQLAMLLEQRLAQPVSVTNATGGKGVTGHNRGMRARPDGYTLTMITFELNTMHWAGLTDLTYADCIPLVSVNEDYAAVLVRADAPWKNLSELESTIRQSPRKLTASGTAVGGAWHLAMAGWLVAAGMDAGDVVWIPSEGSNPSLQQLISGGVDLVCCSLPEARTLIESGDVRAIGVMSDQRAVGFEQVRTFKEQGRQWTLGGWRGLAVPLHTPPAIVQRLTREIEAIVSQEPVPGSFAEFMRAQKFDNTWRGPDEFARFLAENDRKLGQLLQSDAMRSFSQDRISPMTYPYTLMALMGVSVLILLFQRVRGADLPVAAPAVQLVTQAGWLNFALILLAVMAYIIFAETVGFVLTTAAILLLLLVRLGSRPLPSLAITVLFVPVVYAVFAYGLRVPLPRGWLG
ncbi:MAG: tripartite tricarboxylate transporter substrate-binding protein [Aureliella sp.]